MAPLDRMLLVSFGLLTAGGLLAAVLCVRRAMRVADERDGDLKMFLWAAGALVGAIIAGVSTAYILLPLLFGP